MKLIVDIVIGLGILFCIGLIYSIIEEEYKMWKFWRGIIKERILIADGDKRIYKVVLRNREGI